MIESAESTFALGRQAESGAYLPLADVLASQSLPMEMWDSWVATGLVEPAVRLDDSLVLDRAHAIRAMLLAGARNVIPGRCTPEILAFALARAGDRGVPPALVKRRLIARLATLFGLARRALRRATGLSRRSAEGGSAEILAAAERISKRVAENVPEEQRDAVADLVRGAVFGILGVIYLGADVRAQSRRFRAVLRMLGAQADPVARLPVRTLARNATLFADAVVDVRDLLTLEQHASPIFRRLEKMSADRFWTLFDLWPEVSAAVARNWMRLGEVVALPEFLEERQEALDMTLLGTLVLFAGDERSGEPDGFRAQVFGVIETFERAIDRIFGLVEVASAVGRFLPHIAIGDDREYARRGPTDHR